MSLRILVLTYAMLAMQVYVKPNASVAAFISSTGSRCTPKICLRQNLTRDKAYDKGLSLQIPPAVSMFLTQQ